jgi:hypothetical protein
MCHNAAVEPDWVQLRIYSQADTVEINFPVILTKSSVEMMPVDVKLKIEEDEIDLEKLMKELGPEQGNFFELVTDSGRVEMGFIPITKVRTKAKHPPRDFIIEAKNFSLRASLPVLKLLVKSMAGSSEEDLEFFSELARAITRPGRYSIMQVKSEGKKFEVFLE